MYIRIYIKYTYISCAHFCIYAHTSAYMYVYMYIPNIYYKLMTIQHTSEYLILFNTRELCQRIVARLGSTISKLLKIIGLFCKRPL